ncbi:MAG: helix-turn-helix domain-containing protein, partial [Candidatus Eremiobacteraeota bacterium]|nr:helix-turn-helix domain-containing protein [Candidatus Eremiobacteraeota bacterium]
MTIVDDLVPPTSSSDFGMLLRRHRLAAGLSQEALAERARMSSNGISALERGYRRSPQRETLELLAGALALKGEQRREFEAAAHSVGRHTSVTVASWPAAGAGNLPIALTSFIGRERERADIAALVREHRLVTLTGSGGVGKTQTALRVASEPNDTDDAAVCFVGLASVGDSSLVTAAVASALGVQEVPNHRLLETLVAYLKNKTLLLVLDNCEHVIEQAAIVAGSILGACPRVRILATSREPLKAAGEHTYRLPSLQLPSSDAIARLSGSDASRYEAVALFADRVRAVDHHFTPTDENAPTVAEICRRLDGIPLAIELAAARMNLLSLDALAKMLDDRFRLLSRGERTALPRQQTMRATIDWSYDLLSANEKRVFERLAVFAGGCTLREAMAVCGDDDVAREEVFDLLSSLVDKSLVTADLEEHETRYRLLESFREFAREKLAARREADAVAHRHAQTFLELAASFDRVFFYEVEEASVELARAELGNWRAALQWTIADRGDVVLGQRIFGQLGVGFWLTLNSVPEGHGWLVRAVEAIDAATPVDALGRLQLARGAMALQYGEFEEGFATIQRAVESCRAAGDTFGTARAQQAAVAYLEFLGRVSEAKTMQEDLLPLVRSFGSARLLGMALMRLVYINAMQKEYAAARGLVAEARHSFDAIGCIFGVV